MKEISWSHSIQDASTIPPVRGRTMAWVTLPQIQYELDSVVSDILAGTLGNLGDIKMYSRKEHSLPAGIYHILATNRKSLASPSNHLNGRDTDYPSLPNRRRGRSMDTRTPGTE